MIRQLMAQGMSREQIIEHLVLRYGYSQVDAAMLYDIEVGNGGDLIELSSDNVESYPDKTSLVN